MSLNQKRKVRRRLTDRLELAARDAEGRREEEPVVQRAKPTRAPYLEEASVKAEPVGAEAESEDFEEDRESGEPDPAASGSGGPVQLLSASAAQRGKGAQHWMETGLRQTRDHAAAAGALEPPWRAASSAGGILQGGRGIVPAGRRGPGIPYLN